MNCETRGERHKYVPLADSFSTTNNNSGTPGDPPSSTYGARTYTRWVCEKCLDVKNVI